MPLSARHPVPLWLALGAVLGFGSGAAAVDFSAEIDPDALFERLYGATAPGGHEAVIELQYPELPTGGPVWSTLFSAPPSGNGMNSSVNAITTYGGDVIAGGDFTSAGGAAANRIARWNGSTWTGLGLGMNGRVFAVATFGGNLIAGGSFTESGGVVTNHVAQWNGTSWSALGLGLGGPVYALIEYQGQLLAGGDFPGFLARWTGTSWTTFASGLNNTVLALAIHGTSLFVGGRFVAVVNTGDYIVRRDATQWRAINGGVRNFVTSIHVRQDSVYVGGVFSSVGPVNNPVPSKNVAVIDMTQFSGNGQWKAIGTTGTNGPVRAITESGGLIVIGGLFTQIGTTNANNVATYNPVGGGLGTFGSGLGGTTFAPLVRALHVNSGNVWSGGWFETAGGNPSSYIGRWGAAPAPTDTPVLTPPASFAWSVGPNPVVNDTRVSLALASAGEVRLTVHDVRGRKVATLLDEASASGSREVTWSAQDSRGAMPSGVYYLRLAVNGVVETKSVVLTR